MMPPPLISTLFPYTTLFRSQFVNRIARQSSRVVRVRVATGDREHSLRHQLAQRMIDLAGLPLVSQAGGQSSHQSIAAIDRKSTRLNSSHTVISYAVFCLKKK